MKRRNLTACVLLAGLLVSTTGCRQVAKLMFGKSGARSTHSLSDDISEAVAMETVQRVLMPDADVVKEIGWLAGEVPSRLPRVLAPGFSAEAANRAVARKFDVTQPGYTPPPDHLRAQQQVDAQIAEIQRQQILQQSTHQYYTPPPAQQWNSYR